MKTLGNAFATLLYAIIELLKVKTIISIASVATCIILTLNGTLDPIVFVGLASSIITYYFTREKDDLPESRSKPERKIPDEYSV